MIFTTKEARKLFNAKIVNNPILMREYTSKMNQMVKDSNDSQRMRESHSFAIISNMKRAGKLN